MSRDNHHHVAPSRPMNVEQITKEALNYDYNPHIPLRYWLRTAATLIKEASIYEYESNEQQTYLLLFRHADLVLSKLATHPDAKDSKNRKALAEASAEVNKSFEKLESLKPRINKRYARYEDIIRRREEQRHVGSEQDLETYDVRRSSDRVRGPSRDVALGGTAETITAYDNKELAVQLAHQELKRRADAKGSDRSGRHLGSSGRLRATSPVNGQDTDADLSQQMQRVRLKVDANRESGRRSTPTQLLPTQGELRGSAISYPTVPLGARAQQVNETVDSQHYEDISLLPKPPQPPARPPKTDSGLRTVPAKPPKQTVRTAHVSPETTPQSSPKLASRVFHPSAYLENGQPLRTIFLPPDLRKRFLSIADPNTRANRETCGILCGTLISNALFISKLVIPEQDSTSDTCEMINESDLFDYVDGEDLIVLGWIHTHPTQTCFMSSRDLHTHCGYQVMLAESIAIVCAPSRNDWGVFRLTDPPGMKTVLDCTQPGLFHPHSVDNIYTDALRPGHVVEAPGLHWDVHDMRGKL